MFFDMDRTRRSDRRYAGTRSFGWAKDFDSGFLRCTIPRIFVKSGGLDDIVLVVHFIMLHNLCDITRIPLIGKRYSTTSKCSGSRGCGKLIHRRSGWHVGWLIISGYDGRGVPIRIIHVGQEVDREPITREAEISS
jgi:hypothetical protein